MKVFISWSGEVSKYVAERLRSWLPSVLQSVEPWMSRHDLAAGTRWNHDLAKELCSAKFGIICVTRQNLNSGWLHFECGSISKCTDRAVCPYLYDLDATTLTGPLSQFEAVQANLDGTLRLVEALNYMSTQRLERDVLRRGFEQWWPDLEGKLQAMPTDLKKDSKVRGWTQQESMLQEILRIVRSLNADAPQMEPILREEGSPPSGAPGAPLQPALLMPDLTAISQALRKYDVEKPANSAFGVVQLPAAESSANWRPSR